MAWGPQTEAEIAALIGALIDVERAGVGVVARMIDNDNRREAEA